MSDDAPELIRSDTVYGERTPGNAEPLPNKADAAHAELQTLQAEAAELGIEDADRLPLGELRVAVASAKADRG